MLPGILLCLVLLPVVAGASVDQSSLQTLTAQAKAGNRESQYQLGRIYWQGTGIKPDMQQAAHWLLLAAKQGHPRAQFFTGVIYRSGLGVPVDNAKALHWFRLAATWGDRDAQSAYRELKDREMTRQFAGLIQQAQSGDAEARYHLGKIYLTGSDGADKDVQQALHWLQLAATDNHVASQYELGLLYKTGTAEFPKDLAQARKWLQLARDNGSQDALVLLKDIAREQQPASLSTRERMQQLVTGVPFLDQARQGDADAQYRLGLMYVHGEGVDRNSIAGLDWLRKAAAQNHLDAQIELAQLLMRGVDVDKDYDEAAQWYQRAAQAGNPDAQYMLANLYRSGIGVSQDPKLARRWYEEAARQGHAKAQARLGR